MKKLIVLVLSLLVVFTLSACKGDDEIVEVDEFDIFKDVLSSYDVEDTFGVKVEVKQYLSGIIIHHQLVEQMINRSGSVLGETYYYEKEIGPFDVENEFIETEFTTYYQDGEMITEVDGEDLDYEAITFEEYVDGEMLLKGLTKDNFVSYEIQIDGDVHILSGELTIGSVRSIFGTDISMVESNEITVRANEVTKQLVSFVFEYTSEHTRMTFTFTPKYESVEIVVPTE